MSLFGIAFYYISLNYWLEMVFAFTFPPKDLGLGKYSLIYIVFFINPTTNRTIIAFPFNI